MSLITFLKALKSRLVGGVIVFLVFDLYGFVFFDGRCPPICPPSPALRDWPSLSITNIRFRVCNGLAFEGQNASLGCRRKMTHSCAEALGSFVRVSEL